MQTKIQSPVPFQMKWWILRRTESSGSERVRECEGKVSDRAKPVANHLPERKQNPGQISFQMKWTQRTLVQKQNRLKLTNILYRNQTILIRESQTNGNKYYKLTSLYDRLGHWVKSVLRYYSKNKVCKEMKGEIL